MSKLWVNKYDWKPDDGEHGFTEALVNKQRKNKHNNTIQPEQHWSLSLGTTGTTYSEPTCARDLRKALFQFLNVMVF